jgi:ATP-dependent protease ClpP protease subunit
MNSFVKGIVAGLIVVILLGFVSMAHAWEKKPAGTSATADPDTVKSVRWEGSTDNDMLKLAREAVEAATAKDSKIKVLRVSIISGGGPVITSLEIARLLRDASEKKGLIVEIHAEALCASGCTWVLAAGTPGHRYMSAWALFLVHPPQRSGCMEYADEAKTEDAKITNALLDLLRDSYIRYTGASKADVEKWLTCGNEQVGRGDLAVKLGFADKAE